jgi:DNA-directed RNA polymerase subunit RPC12/RpoP
MKKLPIIFLCLALLLGLSTMGVDAQTTNQLQLGLTRDFGYGGFGGDIQGLFTLKVNNPPANLSRVEFFIDSTRMGDDLQAPFNLQFNTDSYPLGAHKLSATGYLADGTQVSSNIIQVQFVPASAATGTVLKIVLPIVGLVVLMIVISFALPLILNKGKLSTLPPGTPRKYGIGGGAICPKCGRPFPLRLWFIHIGVSKIDRCPYCGRFGLVHPRPLAELRAAEQAELNQALPENPVVGEGEAEKLKKELDDSRFQDT